MSCQIILKHEHGGRGHGEPSFCAVVSASSSHKDYPACCSAGLMPTQAPKQPCVNWEKHNGSLAGESLVLQDWARFMEDGEWIPGSPVGAKAQSSHAGTRWPGAGFAQNAPPGASAASPLPAPRCLASPSHWSKASCHSWWPQPCASMSCTGIRMGETTELLLTKQVWCPLHLHFHVEYLADGDGCFGIAQVKVNGQPWGIPLLSVTSQFSIKLRFRCMSRFSCLESSSHQELLNSGFTVGWIVFNLWLISYLLSLTYHYCHNTYYQCWWMLFWLFYFWRFQLFFVSYNYSVREQALGNENSQRYRRFYEDEKLGYPPGRVWGGQERKQGSQHNWGMGVGIALQMDQMVWL